MQLRCRLTLFSPETLRPRPLTAWTGTGNDKGSTLHPWDTMRGSEGDVCREPGSKGLWSTGRLSAPSLGSGLVCGHISQTCECTKVSGQRLEVNFWRCSLECCSPWFLRQDLSLTADRELASLAKLISQSPRDTLVSSPSSGITSLDHKVTVLFYLNMGFGNQTEVYRNS